MDSWINSPSKIRATEVHLHAIIVLTLCHLDEAPHALIFLFYI